MEKFPAESGCLEFKRSVSDKRIPDTVVAFSNTQGGVILIGVEDTGQVKGAPWSGRSEKKLHELLGSINDPGRYEIHRLTVEDRTVVAVAVASRTEGFAQTSNGRLLVRRGASNRAMVGAELSRFVADRALRHFETTATEVDLAEADPDLLAEMAEVWSWSPGGVPDRLEEHGFLERTGAASKLTVAGVLYLVPEPHRTLGKTFVEVFRYRGEGNIDDRREEVVGPLPAQVKRATALVLDEIGYELVVIGVTRYELPRLPEVVLREAIANAVAHRSYEASGAAIRVEIRPDRVTVISPGGLPEPVTINNIREQSSARNLVVINALRRYRLAEDAGRGVDIMQDEMASNLLAPPEFDEDGSYVRVTLPLTGVVTPEERVWVNELERRGSIGSMDRLLLVFAARGEVLTNRRARRILGVDNHQARRALQRLRDQGLLFQRGERGGVEYLIEGGLKPPAGLSRRSILDVQLLGEINRLPGVAGGVRLSDEQIDDMVLGMAREGPVTNTMVRERTGLDRIQALAVLAHLVDAGRLERRGQRRGTHYVLSGSR
ncbi:MAG: putative DNA binding domain-containing protein [bacterium]|nr:putative DNA binding domain-containing protein [bacterium]